MKEAKLDMMTQLGICDGLCITTNGCVKKDGTLVMGAGIAKAIVNADPYGNIAHHFGSAVKKRGHITQSVTAINGTHIISLPTKPGYISAPTSEYTLLNRFNSGQRYPIPGWMFESSISLIRKSCMELVQLTDRFNMHNVLLPRPGCSNGGLDWPTVKEAISFLDDRFTICTL